MQMKRTHNVLSDEAVSFVRRAPGCVHCPILTVITRQLQVPGWVGHCRMDMDKHNEKMYYSTVLYYSIL